MTARDNHYLVGTSADDTNVRKLRDQLVLAGAKLVNANTALSDENARLRKVIAYIVSSGRGKLDDKVVSWAVRELDVGDGGNPEAPPDAEPVPTPKRKSSRELAC